MEVVCEYLGLKQHSAMFAYFRRHFAHFFPALARTHRMTFNRQAANLQAMKDRLWQWVRDQISHDPQLAVVDSLALPVCQFTRAPLCRRFRGARPPTVTITSPTSSSTAPSCMPAAAGSAGRARSS